MNPAKTATAARTLDLYRDAPLPDRVHVAVRWRSCPFPAVAEHLPDSGPILEVGCGHGLMAALAALQSSGRRVTGVDVDGKKIAAARQAAGRARDQGAHLDFSTMGDGELPEGPWQAVVVVDVLYLLDPHEQRALLDACAARLAPGGTLLVKEMDYRPRAKFAWNLAQETLAVRVLGLTEGSRLSFTAPDVVASGLRAQGLTVIQRRLDRGYPHPHHLLVATSSGAAGAPEVADGHEAGVR